MLQIKYCEEQSLNAIKLLLITIFEMLLGFYIWNFSLMTRLISSFWHCRDYTDKFKKILNKFLQIIKRLKFSWIYLEYHAFIIAFFHSTGYI